MNSRTYAGLGLLLLMQPIYAQSTNYVSPQGGMIPRTGKDPEHAYSAAELALALNEAVDVTMLLPGEYTISQTVLITRSGNQGKRKRVIGGRGTNGERPLLRGPWTKTNRAANTFCFSFAGNVDYWDIEGLDFKGFKWIITNRRDEGPNSYFRFLNLRMWDFDYGIEWHGHPDCTGTNCTATNTSGELLFFGMTGEGYVKRFVRLINHCHDFIAYDCHSDMGGREYALEPFGIGFSVGDGLSGLKTPEYNGLFIKCTSGNHYNDEGEDYWNGDSWSFEDATRRMMLWDSHGSRNTDTSYDLKGREHILLDSTSESDKISARVHNVSDGTIKIINFLGSNPVYPGGSGGRAGLWVGGGRRPTVVEVYGSTFWGTNACQISYYTGASPDNQYEFMARFKKSIIPGGQGSLCAFENLTNSLLCGVEGLEGEDPQFLACATNAVRAVDGCFDSSAWPNIGYSSRRVTQLELPDLLAAQALGPIITNLFETVWNRYTWDCEDTIAPSVPTGLRAESVSSNSFVLAWTASTDNVAVTEYEVLRNGAVYGTTSNTSLEITGLLVGTTYLMAVRARDAAANTSSLSSPLSVMTLGGAVERLIIPLDSIAVSGAPEEKSKLIDGNLATGWQDNGNPWIRFDLGETQNVALVKIAWTSGNTILYRFDIQVADTINGPWSTVLSNVASRNTTELETYDFPDVMTRYLRFAGKGNNIDDFSRIREMEIWITAESIPLPSLNIHFDGVSNVRVNWPSSDEGFRLQSTDSLPVGWSDVTDPITVFEGTNVLTIKAEGTRFYRLVK